MPKGERSGRLDENADSSLRLLELPIWKPSLSTFTELGSSVRSGLGLTSKTREPEGRCSRLFHSCASLSYRQRLLGCIICFVLGTLLSLSALSSLGGLLLGNPVLRDAHCLEGFAPVSTTRYSKKWYRKLVGTLHAFHLDETLIVSSFVSCRKPCNATWLLKRQKGVFYYALEQSISLAISSLAIQDAVSCAECFLQLRAAQFYIVLPAFCCFY